jgi:hypothetical protein
MQVEFWIQLVLSGLIITTGTGRLEAASNAEKSAETFYRIEHDAIVRENGTRYHNRPLYGDHRPAVLLAGDRPMLRYVHSPFVGGSMMIGVVRGDRSKWLHEFSIRKSFYRAGQMEWRLQDDNFDDLLVQLKAVTVQGSGGFALRLSVEQARNGDQVIWCFGGASHKQQRALWALDPEIHPYLMQRGFVPKDCVNDQVTLRNEIFQIELPAKPAQNQTDWIVAGQCDRGEDLVKADARQWKTPAQLEQSRAKDHPITCGVIPLQAGDYTLHWVVRSGPRPACTIAEWLGRPMEVFQKNLERVHRRAQETTVDTPDERLNVAVPMITAALDGAWYSPVFVHGSMSWNIPFPGWRTIYGPTAFGWHDRVLQQGQHYISAQAKESDKTGFKADPAWGLTVQDSSSRYYGKGRIQKDQHFYNFQEVFFDQMIHAWRWTGNEQLGNLLRPALELHLEYMKDCFDPDGNGVYESYINVWASDSVWYNGGETTQSTAYAYNGHRAAAELAGQAGDHQSADKHNKRAAKIRTAMKERLWVPDKGYLGEYRETTGHKRLHDDPCLYSLFLPVDANMLDPFEAASTLYFTEWGLERESMSAGGERCWHSNWVPYVWSVRELSIADSGHLAMAYYQAGLNRQAWKLLEGCFAESMLNSPVPGGIQVNGGGTDFNGATSMLARIIVEGLFGYRPDRPQGVVHCRPQFPAEWNKASISTKDFTMFYSKGNDLLNLDLQLAEPAEVKLTLPVYGQIIQKVTVNGREPDWRIEPGFGQPLLKVQTDKTAYVSVELKIKDSLSFSSAEHIEVVFGQQLTLKSEKGEIVEYKDPTGILKGAGIREGRLHVQIPNNPGHFLVFARVKSGDVSYWQLYKLNIKPPEGAPKAEPIMTGASPEARWYCVDMQASWNGDVRNIFKHEYLSPRPQTCSAQLGTDGYSPWTFYPWGRKPPEINLSAISDLAEKDDRLRTQQEVVFQLPRDKQNIAFTSLWDNWPDKISVPVNISGEAVWLLVAGSTNHMQTKIANGIIRLHYAEGEKEELELINPENYWSLEANYDYQRNGFCLPKTPPPSVRLGKHCRAMVYGLKLRKDRELQSIELETRSQELIIGLMGISVMNPQR